MSALTAKQVILRITLIVAFAELMIMLLLGNFFPQLSLYAETAVDVLLLVLVASPAIYYWVINPFIKARDDTLQQVSHLALTDSLTQISNRRQLLQLLQMSISSCKRHNYYGALLLIDLNRFKPVNDRYGHNAGDAVLVEIASRLNNLVREEDAVGRLGGDEFIIILSRLGDDEAAAINELGHITQRVITSLRWPILFEDHKLKITASTGIRLIEPDSPDVETVMKQADAAMYISKQSNQEFAVTLYNPALHSSID